MALTSAERMRQGRVTDADGREVSSLYVSRPVVVVGADPAAGAEISVTVPAGEVWELLGLRVVFVTDATVANRTTVVNVTVDGTLIQRFGSGVAQAASNTFNFNFFAGAGFAGQMGGVVTSPLPYPPLVVLPGAVIATQTVNLQAGDNYGAPVLYVVKHVA